MRPASDARNREADVAGWAQFGYALSQMDTSIEARVEAIRRAIVLLVERLHDAGYIFARPNEALPGVEKDVECHITRITGEIGRVPHAVAVFWRQIGSVDLCGHHPEWTGCDYPDPLVVLPSSEAIAELNDFLADKDERLRCDFPYLIPIAGDYYQKEDVSGGMWYNVDCPATSDNPIVNDEGRDLPFLDYLEMALYWGGFPGLERCREHSWPLRELASGLLTAADKG